MFRSGRALQKMELVINYEVNLQNIVIRYNFHSLKISLLFSQSLLTHVEQKSGKWMSVWYGGENYFDIGE